MNRQTKEDLMTANPHPDRPLGYRDRRGYNVKRIYLLNCCRKQHRVLVTLNGHVCFLDHGGLSLQALIAEGDLRERKSVDYRGCYYLAHVLLNFTSDHNWTSRHSRRTSVQARAFEAGLPDEIFPFIHEQLSKRAERRGSYFRHRRHDAADEYGESFHKNPWARVLQFLALRHELVQAKMLRVAERLEAQGKKVPRHSTY